MDKNFENWEQPAALPNTRGELDQIRKNLRKRSRRTVLASVILAGMIFLCAVLLVIPTAETLYWDPTVCSYLENVTDLELTMVTYNHLFGHGQHMMPPTIKKTGFADYSIETNFVKWETMNRLTAISRRSTSLTKGILHTDSNFWLEFMEGSFIRENKEDDLLISHNNEESKKILSTLPEYIQVLASVSFPKDLSMEQLQILENRLHGTGGRLLWAILRSSDPSEYVYPCGIQLTDYLTNRYQTDFWKETPYPNLFPERNIWSPKSMEQHIISTLRFSADQVSNGTGIIPPGEDASYYETALGYMEDNGIKTYGCYLITTPEVLLDLMDDGTVSYVYLIDAWIGL